MFKVIVISGNIDEVQKNIKDVDKLINEIDSFMDEIDKLIDKIDEIIDKYQKQGGQVFMSDYILFVGQFNYILGGWGNK